jgi:hypothetical protein
MTTLPSVFPLDPFRPLAEDDEARLRPLAFVVNRDRELVPFVVDPHFGRLALPPFGDGRDELPA